MNDVSIIEFEDKYKPAFKALNLEWLVKYNLLEDRDLDALDHPRETIIETGGVIYLAIINGTVAGSSAVIKEHGEYELAKMAVANEHRGKGISKLLLDKCIDFTKRQGAQRLMLYSNSQLRTALALYERYGFKNVEIDHSPFVTADVKMELQLS